MKNRRREKLKSRESVDPSEPGGEIRLRTEPEDLHAGPGLSRDLVLFFSEFHFPEKGP